MFDIFFCFQIVGAIISYIIIVIQFQNPSLGEPVDCVPTSTQTYTFAT